MTESQLKMILESVPSMLAAFGVLAGILVGLYIQIKTKVEVRELKEKGEAGVKKLEDQGKEIIHQTNSTNSALQTDIKALQAKQDVFIERISGLERQLTTQAEVSRPVGPTIKQGKTK